MTDWEPPYESSGKLGLRILLGVAGLLPLGGYLATPGRTVGGALGVVGVVAFWQLFVWRVLAVDVFVGAGGVRVCHLARSRTIPWYAVRQIWIGQARDFEATAIWITVSGPDGPWQLETPVWRRGPVRHNNRIILEPDEFYQVYVRLHEAWRRHAGAVPQA